MFCWFLALAVSWTGCTSPTPACCRAKVGVGTGYPTNPTADLTTDVVVDSLARWQQDDGQPFQLASLRGHPVVISMFYATCEGVCVITKNDLKAVEASLPAAVAAQTAFVLVTLDPEHDSAAVLHKYRLAQGLSTVHWRLLRGSMQDTARLATALGIGFGRDQAGLLRHSSQLVVVDKAGQTVERQEAIQADLTAVVKALTVVAQR
jgi:protein SCO1/2